MPMLRSARSCFCLLLPFTLFCLCCSIAQVVPFLCFLMGMGAGVAAFLAVSVCCLSICKLPDPACLYVWLLACFPSLGTTCCHPYRIFLCFAQNLDRKKPTQKQFFLPLALLIPEIFIIFFPPHCISWYYLLLLWEPLSVLSTARITAGFPVTCCLPHWVWQMHKAGRQRPLMLKGVGHCVYYLLPSHQQASMRGSVKSIRLFLSERFLSTVFRCDPAFHLDFCFSFFFSFLLIGTFLNLQGAFFPISISIPV